MPEYQYQHIVNAIVWAGGSVLFAILFVGIQLHFVLDRIRMVLDRQFILAGKSELLKQDGAE